MNWSEFLALALAHAFAVASPGPDFAVVSKNTVQYGKTIGIFTALGVGFAILLHVSYALLGFSVLVQANAKLYLAIRWLGALYLLYIGWLELSSKPKNTLDYDSPKDMISRLSAFRIGFFTNALNVKAMLFFLFLFTTLVQSDTPINQKLFYGLYLSVYTFLWFYLIASVFGIQSIRSRFLNYGVWFSRVMGVILIVFALILLFK